MTEALIPRLAATDRADLVEILQELLPEYDGHTLYMLAGELTDWLGRRGRPVPGLDLAWQSLGKGIDLQNLTIHGKLS